MKIPSTPLLWLLWVHEATTNDVIRTATRTATGTLTIMEAHTAIAILGLSHAGPRVMPIVEISRESGRPVPTDRMRDLKAKGHVRQAAPKSEKCTAWIATASGLREFADIRDRLDALITKANPVQAANNLLDSRQGQ